MLASKWFPPLPLLQVTPHGLRSTNMSILDAHTLAQCLREHLTGGGSVVDLDPALDHFQKARIPVTTQEVRTTRPEMHRLQCQWRSSLLEVFARPKNFCLK
jgi:2-polyprenyl-6-methoxyphenol hydroxylase-like FAD-dependent oxidoreductase